MSWRIASPCAERRFGNATLKQIIVFLADKASDDGTGIRCSNGAIQRHTELGESTAKRTINDFLREGLLVKTSAMQERLHGHLPHYSGQNQHLGPH
ncbi:MAG: hypothetical protein OXN84_17165 [Albidovulum sp.]|nr:hypothetical protein [Albidovulum sp.]MDE0531546.1 hypothetical protein [Albidovulum sp.]